MKIGIRGCERGTVGQRKGGGVIPQDIVERICDVPAATQRGRVGFVVTAIPKVVVCYGAVVDAGDGVVLHRNAGVHAENERVRDRHIHADAHRDSLVHEIMEQTTVDQYAAGAFARSSVLAHVQRVGVEQETATHGAAADIGTGLTGVEVNSIAAVTLIFEQAIFDMVRPILTQHFIIVRDVAPPQIQRHAIGQAQRVNNRRAAHFIIVKVTVFQCPHRSVKEFDVTGDGFDVLQQKSSARAADCQSAPHCRAVGRQKINPVTGRARGVDHRVGSSDGSACRQQQHCARLNGENAPRRHDDPVGHVDDAHRTVPHRIVAERSARGCGRDFRDKDQVRGSQYGAVAVQGRNEEWIHSRNQRLILRPCSLRLNKAGVIPVDDHTRRAGDRVGTGQYDVIGFHDAQELATTHGS